MKKTVVQLATAYAPTVIYKVENIPQEISDDEIFDFCDPHAFGGFVEHHGEYATVTAWVD